MKVSDKFVNSSNFWRVETSVLSKMKIYIKICSLRAVNENEELMVLFKSIRI